MNTLKKLGMVALIIGVGAMAVPAMAGKGYGPGNGTGGTRPQDGTGNCAKKGTCPKLSSTNLDSVMLVAGRNGNGNGKRGGGYGPGGGTGGGTRPQDGTGYGAKKGTCVKS